MKDNLIEAIGSLITEDPDTPVDDDDVFASVYQGLDLLDADEVRQYIQFEVDNARLGSNAAWIPIENFGGGGNLYEILDDLSDEFDIEEGEGGFYVSAVKRDPDFSGPSRMY